MVPLSSFPEANIPKAHCSRQHDQPFVSAVSLISEVPPVLLRISWPALAVPRRGAPVYGQNGVDLSFSPVLCLLAYGGHCSQILVFTCIWGTQKGVWQWHFSCCFAQRLVILGPPNTAKQGKTQNDKSTLLYPPTPEMLNRTGGTFNDIHFATRGPIFLGGRFGYFFFFLLGGGGEGESEAPGGGAIGFLIQIPRWGGGFQEGEGQDAFDHDKEQKSAISGRRLHWIFSNFLQWILFPFLQVYCAI